MTLETLVVAVGPHDASRVSELETAILDIAKPTDVTVVLFHVFSEEAYESGIEDAGYDPTEPPSADTLASRLECVDMLADTLEDEDISYDIVGEIGPEGDTILRKIDAFDADLLYISGRSRSPTGKAVFGSTSHRILMNSSCPVLFVREGIYETEAT